MHAGVTAAVLAAPPKGQPPVPLPRLRPRRAESKRQFAAGLVTG
jgi:hypothetical protein